MPPKFQSSFIPKGPMAASPGTGLPPVARVRHVDLFSLIAKLAFALSIILALAAVGYKWYLGYSIKKMGLELEQARQEIAGGVVSELVNLNNRITSTESLVKGHHVLSPLFSFLQTSMPKTVRFTEFDYFMGEQGPEITARGEATSYAALALESQAVNANPDFLNPVFSDIRLDERGNVNFSLKASVASALLSYQKVTSRQALPTQVQTTVQTATSTATSTPATTTPRTSTTTPR